MFLCYVDESGTPDTPGTSSHYILAGLAIPIWNWRKCDEEIRQIKSRYGLENSEIHVAWMLRSYSEQAKINNFDNLLQNQRRNEVRKLRNQKLLDLQAKGDSKKFRQQKKNYKKTEPYVHLTTAEREACIEEVAECISNWGEARLFAECIDKIYFDPAKSACPIDEQAFEQVISRFHTYLRVTASQYIDDNYGLIIHDNNETVAKRHTKLMNNFHEGGTLWTSIDKIIETPLYVDSSLTSMVQMSDLCGYALRRYVENGEEKLFKHVFKRADRKGKAVVGVRHFSERNCRCKICKAHSP